MKANQYVVSLVFTNSNSGNVSISLYAVQVEAVSNEEALGKGISGVNKEYKKHLQNYQLANYTITEIK